MMMMILAMVENPDDCLFYIFTAKKKLLLLLYDIEWADDIPELMELKGKFQNGSLEVKVEVFILLSVIED